MATIYRATAFGAGGSASMTLASNPFALAVDDDPIILMGICDILEEAGFGYYEASSGDEAKTVLAAHGDTIMLLFSDVNMPGETDGFALAHHTAENWPHIEIVVASGYVLAQPGDLPPKATFIQKPFNAHVVKEHLRSKLPDWKKTAPLRW